MSVNWDAPEYKTKGYTTSFEGRKMRISICEECDKLTKLKVCKLCNCFMPIKIWAKFVDCPDNKWTREVE